MAANIEDLITKASSVSKGGVGFPAKAVVSKAREVGGNTLEFESLEGWTTDTAVHFSVYDPEDKDNTQVDYKGIVEGNTVTNLTRIMGNEDIGNKVGNIAVLNPTFGWLDDIYLGLSKTHNQSGELKENVVQEKNIANGAVSKEKLKSDVLSSYATKDDVNLAVTSVYKYRGSVENQEALPQSEQTTGDVYNVEDTGDNYAWDGKKWDKLAGTVDLSGYATTANMNSALEKKADKTEVESALALKADKTELDKKQNKLMAGTNITIEGDTINATAAPYTLPAATKDKLGGVKVGEGLAVTEDGTLSASGGASVVEYTDSEWNAIGFKMS